MKKYTLQQILDFFEREQIMLICGDNPLTLNKETKLELNEVATNYINNGSMEIDLQDFIKKGG